MSQFDDTSRFDESIAGQTWVARALNLREFYPIDRPWPPAFQSGRNPDFEVYLPEAIGGEIAEGEGFISAVEALESQTAPELSLSLEVLRAINPGDHTTYSVDIAGTGMPTPVLSFNRNRSYLLVVNEGANDVTIAYGRDADAQSLNLASGGVGFHELVNGTVSTMSAFAALGAPTRLSITEGYFYPRVYS